MNCTVTALYDTQAQAEQARAALVAAHLGDHVTIHDRSSADKHHNFGAWLSGLFGEHQDKHVYDEGVRRGHILLSAKVDDLNEIRAAKILDAAQPVDLSAAEQAWRAEGWTPATTASVDPVFTTTGRDAAQIGLRVRTYYVTTKG